LQDLSSLLNAIVCLDGYDRMTVLMLHSIIGSFFLWQARSIKSFTTCSDELPVMPVNKF